jgi:hypothetical protein
MINADIYQKNPATRRLANEGVASVNDEQTTEALTVLRYELETFVCNGQYEKGLVHILETYLKNIQQAQQPAVWVSGFFGSGKSHLIKMLRALWLDTKFEDGATARGIVNLPSNISDLLKELNVQSKRYGGLHAASGTLGAGASGSVRLALLRIIFKSANLPQQYPVACFVMWLKREGIFDQVKAHVESLGIAWQDELDNFYMAEGLRKALVEAKPNLFSSTKACGDTLRAHYPNVQDVSSDDMIKTIRQALSHQQQFPLTLVVLDEVQQYIGEDSQRSIDVQEMVEAVSKNIGGKLIFIGTGQTAVTGTSNLKKLEGRFTIRIELSDADVDAVIRQVILAKKAEAKAPIDNIMQNNLGEISRHLSGTTIGHRQGDVPFFPQDYPILPVRRRFWENTLRVLDQTGTDSQLRNQLSMIHKVIQTNLDKTLGCVVPGDYLYFDSAEKLLQARILPRKVYEKTMSWIKGSEDEKLMARACGLVFLINKLAGSNNEIGIRASVDSLADLLIEDLGQGSSSLRSKLPLLLDKCEILMKVGSDYRIQTEESSAWNDEFLSQKSNLANESHRIEVERDDRIRKKFGELVRKLSLMQGSSKVTRDISPIFDAQLPADAQQRICLWVRDGWSTDEDSVRADARQLGQQSATILVFIPKRSAEDLRHQLIDFKAANSTLDNRGIPNTPEGTEARAAMETTKQSAEGKIRELLDECFAGTRVFQAGGQEIVGSDLQDMILDAANTSLLRFYPQFQSADHVGWSKVYEKAKMGAPDALKMVGDEGEPAKNAVCKALAGFIAGGKSGNDLRLNFEGSPYGWSRDAVDGGLQVLLVSGLIRAQDERGQTLDPKELERKSIGKVMFKVESSTVSTAERIQIRKLLQKVSIQAKQGEELTHVATFLQKCFHLAAQAGGDAPQPMVPDTKFLDNIRLSSGNDQLKALYHQRELIAQSIDQWQQLAQHIEKRCPLWEQLRALSLAAQELPAAEMILSQVQAIEAQRQLLDEPDPLTPLIQALSHALRDELNQQHTAWKKTWDEGEAKLLADPVVQAMAPEQIYAIRKPHQLTEEATPTIEVADTKSILKTLARTPLSTLRDRIAALPSRFNSALVDAAKAMEPKVQEVHLSSPTLKSESDIDAWLAEMRIKLVAKLKDGPVLPR